MQTLVVAFSLGLLACSSSTVVYATHPADDGGAIDDPASDAGNTPLAEASDDVASPAPTSCSSGARTGSAGGQTDLSTADGILYNVRTPSAYQASVGSPLIVVFSPAGGDRNFSETYTGLTPGAVARGYLIAYVDHIQPEADTSADTFIQGARVPTDIAAKWCIDPKRVYLTGHSDGGSFAEVIGLRKLVDVAAIAPSASGADMQYVQAVGCRSPLPVMKMHSTGDQVFPPSQGFGPPVAQWWATCNGCGMTPSPADSNGCVTWSGCSQGDDVELCTGSAPHPIWPGLDTQMLDFFDKHVGP